jgi:glutathione S-transferase
MRVHGVNVSYYTGKLEAYLRYEQIPYELVDAPPNTLREKTGAAQVPALELDDGEWLTDSTPIIERLERERAEFPVVPDDPLQAFAAWLIEDYADEWLWRPAMHYRWSYDLDKHTLSRLLVSHFAKDLKLPGWLLRRRVRKRQLGLFVTGDGVTPETRTHVEAGYLRALDLLSEIFGARPFVLGERPTIADIGLMGPMLRHFAQDPTPAEIMRNRAPAVWEWVARMWNARGSDLGARPLPAGVPADLEPLLIECCETNLVQHSANATAWRAGDSSFDVEIQGTHYRSLPTSRYRVWCLEQLRARFEALDPANAASARDLLQRCGGWDALWHPTELDSGHEPTAGGLEVLTAPASRRARG